MKFISYGKQFIDSNDLKSVNKSLKKNKLTTGPLIDNFEKLINKNLGSKYSVACNSGTSAIYLAFRSIGINKNDKIIMPAINFVSSYNVAKLLGAQVYLADVDSESGIMRPQDVENCCKKFNLKRVKIILVMYHAGYPLDAEKFKKIKKKYKSFIVEDACHALGAQYIVDKKRYKVGSCKHSDISTFSFHPVKTITTGEGGAITTNSKKLYEKIKLLRSIGIFRFKNHWSYDVKECSLNFRISDIQCALGISQIKKMKKFLSKRKKIVKNYFLAFKNIQNISLINHLPNYISGNHLCLLKLKKFNLKKKDLFFKYMMKKKILLQYHYIPIYKFSVFKDKYYAPNAEKYYNQTISIPIYYSLSKKEQNYVINNIINFFKEYKF